MQISMRFCREKPRSSALHGSFTGLHGGVSVNAGSRGIPGSSGKSISLSSDLAMTQVDFWVSLTLAS